MITYFEVLLYFIIPPIIGLALLAHRQRDKIRIHSLDSRLSIFLLAIIAFVYTTPWDNYLVASGVWFYDEQLVSGIIFYYVPLEEYLFFLLETVLVSLLFLNLQTFNTKRLFDPKSQNINNRRTRLISLGFISIVWLISLYLLIFGSENYSYLALILVWALIPIAIQVGYGADIIWHNIVTVFATITISTVYLSLVDAYAISSGTWTIAEQYSLYSLKIGIMPLEEILFFFITSVLVTFGILLSTNYQSQMRLYRLLDRYITKNVRIVSVNTTMNTH